MEQALQKTMKRFNCSEGEAREYLAEIQPDIAKEVMQQEPAHIYFDYIKSAGIREIEMKDGKTGYIEEYELAGGKKVTTFHRNGRPSDNSNLGGTRVPFFIRKERVNQFTGDIEFQGCPVSVEDMVKMLGLKENGRDSHQQQTANSVQSMSMPVPNKMYEEAVEARRTKPADMTTESTSSEAKKTGVFSKLPLGK